MWYTFHIDRRGGGTGGGAGQENLWEAAYEEE